MNEAQAVPHPDMLYQEEMNKKQRNQPGRIEILKNWRIEIQALDRGCTVSVGCKIVAFESIDAAMEMVNRYADDPISVIKHYGFENHI